MIYVLCVDGHQQCITYREPCICLVLDESLLYYEFIKQNINETVKLPNYLHNTSSKQASKQARMSNCHVRNYNKQQQTTPKKQNQNESSNISSASTSYYGYGKRKRCSISTLTSAGRRRYHRRQKRNKHTSPGGGTKATGATPTIPTMITITIKPPRHSSTALLLTVDDYVDCGKCGSDCLFEKTTSCSSCEVLRCHNCPLVTCTTCQMREDRGEYLTLGPQVCTSCIAPQCVSCPDLIICKQCMGQCCAKQQQQTLVLSTMKLEGICGDKTTATVVYANGAKEQLLPKVSSCESPLKVNSACEPALVLQPSTQDMVTLYEESLREMHRSCYPPALRHLANLR